jgi:hypothetical protein
MEMLYRNVILVQAMVGRTEIAITVDAGQGPPFVCDGRRWMDVAVLKGDPRAQKLFRRIG